MILFADLSHVAEESRATGEVNCLREFEELSLCGESGRYCFAFGASVFVTKALVVEENLRHSLAVETRDQIAQAGVGDLFVVSRHRVRRAFE